MTRYFDTGILMKLYTPEPESRNVQRFVSDHGKAIPFHTFHLAEFASAFHLKAFRGECEAAQANRALADVEEDRRSGVLYDLLPDWELVWLRCVQFATAHAAETGCRTLDTLHVACAVEMGFREFVTSDRRQAALAKRLGLTVHNPT
jgi:predicted nucleic acid-binding protein